MSNDSYQNLSIYDFKPRTIVNRELIYVLAAPESEEFHCQNWDLNFFSREFYDDNSVSEFSRVTLERRDANRHWSNVDRVIIKAIFEYARKREVHGHDSDDYARSYVQLDSELAAPLLAIITKANKLFYAEARKKLKPIKFDSASRSHPVQLQIDVKSSGGKSRVNGALQTAGRKIDWTSSYYHLDPFILIGDTFYYSDLESLDALVESFRRRPKFILKDHEVPGLLSELHAHRKLPNFKLPKKFIYRTIKGFQKVRLIIDRVTGSENLSADLEYKYGQSYIPTSEASHRILDHDAKTIHEIDLKKQLELKRRLLSHLDRSRPSPGDVILFKERRLLELIGKAFQDKWEVIAFGKSVSQSREFKLKASSGIDWFDLGMNLSFTNGQIATLPDLLRDLRHGKKILTLADGTLGVLNDELIKKFSNLALGVKLTNGKVRLSRAQALYFSSVLSEDKSFASNKKFQTIKKVAKVSHSPRISNPDKNFTGKLRLYQKKGLSWLEAMSGSNIGCLLADDMGLGKTVCILALLSKKMTGQALIVVPKTLIANWVEEAERFVKHLKVHAHVGGGRSDLKGDFKNANIILTTYHTLRNDIDFFRNKKFEYLVVDEAQNIKNPEADIHRACRLIEADKKIALTGTPIENSLGDLFSILNVIAPGLVTKESWNKYADSEDQSLLSNVQKALQPFILRRRKEEVLKDLPKKTEQVIYCDLSSSEKRDYDQLRRHLWAILKGKIEKKGMNRAGAHVLKSLLRLRQAACHQGLLKKSKAKSTSAKFEVLLEQLETILAEGHKVLIFSTFAQVLKLLEPHLIKKKINYEYMDGKTNNRQSRVKSFQEDPKKRVFLITLKTGGVGLNLTAANYVFILDPWWNPATESQAIDRTHRIGQKNKVTAYKLISRDTVEEKVLALQTKKKAIADAIINVSKKGSVLKNLTPEQLEILFS